MNILYLDDYINFYSDKLNKIVKIIPYKDTLRNGIIINKNKFIKKMIKELNKIGIKNSIFSNSIKIIINNYYTIEDKELLKLVLEELNYKNVIFIQEIDYLNINKNKIYINCNYSYFYVLYTNYYGNIEINMYKNDVVNKGLFINILNNFLERDIFLYGKNIKEFENILNFNKINYYIFEEANNLIINYYLKSL